MGAPGRLVEQHAPDRTTHHTADRTIHRTADRTT